MELLRLIRQLRRQREYSNARSGDDDPGAAAMLAALESAIDDVADPRDRLLLYLHYVQGLSWEQVADRMGYSVPYIYVLRRRALLHLAGVDAG